MFDISTIPTEEKNRIVSNLFKWGIVTNMADGTIDYIDAELPEMKCESIHLIRHTETVAVAKHEFMSDTSDNCSFTEAGIALTHKQARELADYHFDVALVGPIARVVNTKEIIMQTPQSFECVPVKKLHGIDNTGWEYKTYSIWSTTRCFWRARWRTTCSPARSAARPGARSSPTARMCWSL